MQQSRRALWRTPVIQLLGGLGWRTVCGWEPCGASTYVDRASALSSASIWTSQGSLRWPGCLRRNEPGEARKGAAKSSHVDQ